MDTSAVSGAKHSEGWWCRSRRTVVPGHRLAYDKRRVARATLVPLALNHLPTIAVASMRTENSK
eukprot:SAG31_NODE_901_length_11133_cov_9.476799_8_plen_64_part_00